MPGRMDGVDLATMLAATRPALPVVVMSTDPRELARATARELARATARGLDVPTLAKPFGKDELLAAVADARRCVPIELSRAGRTVDPWEARHG